MFDDEDDGYRLSDNGYYDYNTMSYRGGNNPYHRHHDDDDRDDDGKYPVYYKYNGYRSPIARMLGRR